jgi:hypothetical protein
MMRFRLEQRGTSTVVVSENCPFCPHSNHGTHLCENDDCGCSGREIDPDEGRN